MNENLTREQLIEQRNYYKNENKQLIMKYNKMVKSKNKEIIILQLENERLKKEIGKKDIEILKLF